MPQAREVAWRVFAGEFNGSDLEHSTGGERMPSYIVTPLGAKVNRMLVVGVITDLENIGAEGNAPLWRARVSDPTGVFYISAGQYQPKAADALSKMKAPSFVAIVGKSKIYRPEGGGVYLSIRPEFVKPADEKLRSYWVLEACRNLKLRIEAMEEAMKMETSSRDELKALGYSDDICDGVVLALDHYRGKLDIGRYRTMLTESLKFITPEKRFSGFADAPETADEATGGNREQEIAEELDDEDSVSDGRPSKKSTALEEKVLKIIGENEKGGKGVPYEQIIEKSRKEKIEVDELEEAFNSLLGKGLVYEPSLGQVKLVKQKGEK